MGASVTNHHLYHHPSPATLSGSLPHHSSVSSSSSSSSAASSTSSLGLHNPTGTASTSSSSNLPHTYLYGYTLEEILVRVKDVLQRDKIKQKELAKELGFSGSTLSPMLKLKYKHIKSNHVECLKQWLYGKDLTFRQNTQSQLNFFNIDTNTVLSHLHITKEQWEDWLQLAGNLHIRKHIDTGILQLFHLYSLQRVNAATLEDTDLSSGDSSHSIYSTTTTVPTTGTDAHDTSNSAGNTDTNGQENRKTKYTIKHPVTFKLVKDTFPSLVATVVPMVVSSVGSLAMYGYIATPQEEIAASEYVENL